MKVMVMFDLPTTAPNQRRVYARFRKQLLKWGFTALQESVYVKECDDEWHVKRVRGMVGRAVPPEGKVATCGFSDRQWAGMLQYEDGERVEEPSVAQPLVMLL